MPDAYKLRKKAQQTVKDHPEATAVGAVAAGVAAKPYYRVARAANNARVLAKPGRMKGLVETLEHHQGAPTGAEFHNAAPFASRTIDHIRTTLSSPAA